MILLDSDVMIDLLRQYPPAMKWFDTLDEEESLLLPGYVIMELIQGCRNKMEQEKLQRELATYGTVWLTFADCDKKRTGVRLRLLWLLYCGYIHGM